MNKVYNRIESITGNVITVKATGVQYKELAQINTRFGKSLAQVNKIEGDIVSLQVFAGGQGVSTGDEVRFLGHEMRVSFSDELLGRIFTLSYGPVRLCIISYLLSHKDLINLRLIIKQNKLLGGKVKAYLNWKFDDF